MIVLLSVLGACSGIGELHPFGGPPGDRDDREGWGPPDTGLEGLVTAPGAGFPFERPGKLFEIALNLPEESVDGLVYNGDYVPATFTLDGLSTEVGVRLKGSSTFDDLDGKPSLKLDFSAFTPTNRFLELERLTLNAMKFDPTMLREATAYKLFEDVGVPAPRHGFAEVTINGAPYGVYSIVETLDEHFLKRAFPGDADGHLYDSTFIAADLTGLGVANFDLQEGDPATAYADLDQLVSELNGGNINDVLDTRFDANAVLTFLAVDLVSPNWDGYSRNTNNYLLYHASVSDRWYFVPWGQDTAFRGGGLLWAAVRGRVAAACQSDGACKARLEEACKSVLATWEETDLLGYATTLNDTVGPACEADPRKKEGCDQEDHLEVLANRPAEVRRELP